MNVFRLINIKDFIIFCIICQMVVSVVLGVFFPFEPSIAIPTKEFEELFEKTFGIEFTTEQMPRSYYYFEQFNYGGSDSIEYLKIAAGKESFPPFSLRPLYPKIVGFFSSLFFDPNENMKDFLNIALLINIFNNCVLILI